MEVEKKRLRLEITGRVQGVGFRPAVYQLAQRFALSGWVGNARHGVVIEIEGPASSVSAFESKWLTLLPALARVDEVTRLELSATGEPDFVIRGSEVGGKLTLVPPDLALCPQCRQELFAPQNRRYRYPFINCTSCGPRYSITEALPYDRANTVMRHFPVCPECQSEYTNPQQRRFHHQTITCSTCGPQLAFWHPDGTVLAEREAALTHAVAQLRAGAILAVKGLGGFHLMLDANHHEAIARLRAFKQRPSKPFAVMFAAVSAVKACCSLSAAEEAALLSSASPLLLLDWNGSGVDPLIAPLQKRLGVLLPYTPLHALLLHDFGGPLLATSGNRGGEPICIDEQEALKVFSGLVDGLLVHNRPIIRGVDDSIAQWAGDDLRVLRRARGWVPEPLTLKESLPAYLATGGHLKTTVALSVGQQVVVSTHLGDLDTGTARDLHAQTTVDMARLLEVTPQLLVHDSHADYATSLWARSQSLPVQPVQHHLAHLAGCALEHQLSLPVMGCIWDGSGLGPDGSLWGGETLSLSADNWQRLAHFLPFSLPGGETAAREPRRCLLGVLLVLLGDAAWEHPLITERFNVAERRLLHAVVIKQINCPSTSSVGRLFDAVSSLLDLCQQQGFEGEAAMLLQGLAESTSHSIDLAPIVCGEALDWRPLFHSLLSALDSGANPAELARAFHQALAQSIVLQAQQQQATQWLLSGGCFQNRLLLNLAKSGLESAGVQVFIPRDYPAGDGGLSLGQIAVQHYLFSGKNTLLLS